MTVDVVGEWPDRSGSEFGVERSRRFAKAMAAYPNVRRSELDCLDRALARVGIDRCDQIVDLGAGHGFVTTHLLRYLRPGGTVHAVDDSAEMLSHLPAHPAIHRYAAKLDRLAVLRGGSVDLAISFASFHHVPNKNQVLHELARLLKPGGIFIISDVCDETPTQRFFDSVVSDHSITGHETDFLTGPWVALLARRAGLDVVFSAEEPTDWRFDSMRDLVAFVNDLFSLMLAPETLEATVRQLLPMSIGADGRVVLHWTQGFHVLSKDRIQ